MSEISEVKPKLNWVEGKYNSSKLVLGGGFVQATVNWATVSKGEPGGYNWQCNNFHSKGLYRNIEEAQLAVEQFIAKRIQMVAEEVK